MSGLKALIFDVDGTLAETERDGHRIAFNQAFADAGLAWHWDVETYGRLLAVTGGKERMLHYWQGLDAEAASGPQARALVAELHRLKTTHYVRLVAEGGIQLRPGVARLLQQAREAGLRLAIATTTTPDNVEALLHATLGSSGMAMFECIGAGDAVPRKKPDPGIYAWVLERMRLAPSQCLAFEDSTNGWKAADAAGLRTVVTTGAYTARDMFPGALAQLDGLGDADHPAQGRVMGQAWSGVVDIPTLREWASPGKPGADAEMA
ncbi:MAG: HAD family hydrolase [Betaproteobacteria bacterium]|jgi:beta-phosphoglucomutase-like phosphatase (HAD superfamily)|uniref:Protein CbbY, chromosomal n=1 Tax=Thiomonas delicata TaxID=364030 RepID=A0A238D220_THIDL|nr:MULTISPECIES: HAD family hydrolase [Thiomonas]MDE2129332.1 HAD family hydrolase [Betaproteobacteria bacterium]OZB45983.1 MAG: haloacid dehalogenase [Thiomonas sp. 15-66-11]OZB66229.1 MAG: haloacid dehalogenase [Thiomonas sp. 13-66-29]SBP87279.1 Protein CbbY, chromosomal [Thiomonas delicata]